MGSMTGLAEVAMTSFVPHFPAFMGVCVCVPWLVCGTARLCDALSLSVCFINARVLLSPRTATTTSP